LFKILKSYGISQLILLLCSNLYLHALYGSGINITINPTSINVTVGENITLECSANISSPSNISLFWSGPIIHSSFFSQNVTSISDTLRGIAKESYHEKEICCMISANGVRSNLSVFLTVSGMYKIRQGLDNIASEHFLPWYYSVIAMHHSQVKHISEPNPVLSLIDSIMIYLVDCSKLMYFTL